MIDLLPYKCVYKQTGISAKLKLYRLTIINKVNYLYGRIIKLPPSFSAKNNLLIKFGRPCSQPNWKISYQQNHCWLKRLPRVQMYWELWFEWFGGPYNDVPWIHNHLYIWEGSGLDKIWCERIVKRHNAPPLGKSQSGLGCKHCKTLHNPCW